MNVKINYKMNVKKFENILAYKLITIQDFDIRVGFVLHCLFWTLIFHYSFHYSIYYNTHTNSTTVRNKVKNTKDNYNIITNPQKYVNNAMEKNMAFLEVKLNCMIFLNKKINYYNYNKTIYDEITENIRLLVGKIEYMLVGFIDLIEIKLHLDENILKHAHNYKKINMPNHDIESYKNLENIMSRNLEKVTEYTNYLNKTCKHFLVYIEHVDIINTSNKTANTTENKLNVTKTQITNQNKTSNKAKINNTEFDKKQIMNALNKIMFEIENIKKDNKERYTYNNVIPSYSVDNYLESNPDDYNIQEL